MIKSNMKPEEFKKIRKELGITPTEYAYKIGVSASSVWAWENGKRSIPQLVADKVKTIAANKQ